MVGGVRVRAIFRGHHPLMDGGRVYFGWLGEYLGEGFGSV